MDSLESFDNIVRIAVPTEGTGGLDSPRSAHFGHAASFTLVDVAGDEILDAGVIVNPPHEHGGCGATVSLLAQAGATVAIVVGMGPGPMNAMRARGIQALFDDQSPTPRLAAAAYLAGGLAPFGGDHACSGH